MKPGIYNNMPDEDYRAIDAVSKSRLFEWATGDSRINERAALMGTAFDAMLLEGDLAKDKIRVCEHRRNTKAWSSYMEENQGKWVLAGHEYKVLAGMMDSVRHHPEVSRWAELARDTPDGCQFVAIAECPTTGLLLKMRGDFRTENWLYDLKTTSSDPDGFGGSVGKFGYDVQAWMYLYIMRLLGFDYEGRFCFVCCSKRGDWEYPCWMRDINKTELDTGERIGRILLNAYHRHGDKNAILINRQRQESSGCAAESPRGNDASTQDREGVQGQNR